MTAISYMRQRDWFDPAEHPDAHVTIVGVGGIGSPTALALAKLGIPRLTLIDPDYVEPHNLPNQVFGTDTQGDLKVDAALDTIEYFAPVEFSLWPLPLNDPDVSYSGVVISALDSMGARQELWERVRMNTSVEQLLDARLGGENIVVYSAVPHRPSDIARYEETLHSDDEAAEAPCTRQSIIDVGFAVASLLTRAVRRYYAGEPVEPTVFWDHANLMVIKEDR